MTANLDAAAIRRWIERNARPVESTFLRALDSEEDRPSFLVELGKFQNPDGGFGHALECDFWTPDSSAIATTVAFQHLVEVDASAGEPAVAAGMEYLLRSYDPVEGRWHPLPASTNRHPAAPWWEYEASRSWTDWGNPSAEVLAYLIRFLPRDAHAELIDSLTARAIARLDEIGRPQFNELRNYQRLYAAADHSLRDRLWSRLSELIVEAVAQDSDRWPEYGATVLTFVPAPDSPFAQLFDRPRLHRDLDRMERSIVDGDHWEPNWSWGDAHPTAWPTARAAWSGVLTVENLLTLRAFGRL